MASTEPKNPAATGAMWASRWPNSGTYISTIVAAISSPTVTYIHFSGPGPNAARGNTVARARRSTSRNRPTSAAPSEESRGGRDGTCCTPAMLIASAARPSNNSDHSGIRVITAGAARRSSPLRQRPGTNAAIAIVMIASRTESPTPDTELGEYATDRRPDDDG